MDRVDLRLARVGVGVDPCRRDEAQEGGLGFSVHGKSSALDGHARVYQTDPLQ